MTARNTSRVFEVARQVKARLNEQTWPADAATSVVPVITYDVSAQPDQDAEMITVSNDIGDDAFIAWSRMPQGRDEEFDVAILITVSQAHAMNTAAQRGDAEDRMIDRLEQLADIVQRAFFDDTASTITTRNKPLDIPETVNISAVRQVAWAIARTSDGVIGQSFITYGTAFRI